MPGKKWENRPPDPDHPLTWREAQERADDRAFQEYLYRASMRYAGGSREVQQRIIRAGMGSVFTASSGTEIDQLCKRAEARIEAFYRTTLLPERRRRESFHSGGSEDGPDDNSTIGGTNV